MAELTTKYAGLYLKNPIIIGSSGLTDSVEKIKELEKFGAGAVVLKSLFEEEIIHESDQMIRIAKSDPLLYDRLSETLDYVDLYVKEKTVSKYLRLISESKKNTLFPIIASINCITAGEWISTSKKIQDAGADALELNIFIPPTENRECSEIENLHIEIIKKVKKNVTIPIIVKISSYFPNLINFIINLSKTGIDGIVLFNRFYKPDIDVENIKLFSENIYSNEYEYLETLRWTAIVSGKINSSISASTGIHNGETVIKMLLAGAKSVQVVSAIYKNKASYIERMIQDIEKWMLKNNFNYIDQFIGKLSSEQKNTSAFERMQFMKLYSGIK
jgi:dihydroorotate dehydrogenase (fumarate)